MSAPTRSSCADEDRDPSDDLRLAFEATHDLDPDERATLKGIIDAVLLKHALALARPATGC